MVLAQPVGQLKPSLVNLCGHRGSAQDRATNPLAAINRISFSHEQLTSVCLRPPARIKSRPCGDVSWGHASDCHVKCSPLHFRQAVEAPSISGLAASGLGGHPPKDSKSLPVSVLLYSCTVENPGNHFEILICYLRIPTWSLHDPQTMGS